MEKRGWETADSKKVDRRKKIMKNDFKEEQ